MSILPILLHDPCGEVVILRSHPGSICDLTPGLGLVNNELADFLTHPLLPGYCSLRQQQISNRSIPNERNFEVNVDVQQFKPDDLNVKVVDNLVIVEGKHGERQDEHGFISREFRRKYVLPDDVDPNTTSSRLSSDGVLTIEARRKFDSAACGERVVAVVRTNLPATGGRPPADRPAADRGAPETPSATEEEQGESPEAQGAGSPPGLQLDGLTVRASVPAVRLLGEAPPARIQTSAPPGRRPQLSLSAAATATALHALPALPAHDQ